MLHHLVERLDDKNKKSNKKNIKEQDEWNKSLKT